MADQRLNQMQVARFLGVTDRRIRALESQGRLVRGEDGKYSKAQAARVRAKMDPAYIANDRMSRPGADPDAPKRPRGRPRKNPLPEEPPEIVPVEQPEEEPDPPALAPVERTDFPPAEGADDELPPGRRTEKLDRVNDVYMQARSHKAAFEAKTAELRYRQLAGELVDAKMAKMTSFVIARKVRTKLQNLPTRLSHLLDDEGREAMQREIRDLIKEMQEDIARI